MQNPALVLLEGRANEIMARANKLAAPLTVEQLDWRPTPESWGVGLCLEHLVVTQTQFHALMQPALARALARETSPPTRGPEAWSPSLWGRIFRWALGPRGVRAPSPAIFRPGERARPGVLAAFLALQRDLVDLMKCADTIDPARVRLHSPVSVFIRLHLGDCFDINVTHAERHLGQAERARAHPQFPAG